MDTQGLAENSPLQSFWYACMQGLLSVNMQALWCDCIRCGLKCLVATAIARASTSHDNHVNCEPRNLALKKPARRNLSLRVTYSVAPIPGLRRAPSVTSWLLGAGEWDGASSGKSCLGLAEWCAEVVCPLNRLLRFTACNSVVECCKKWRASGDNAGEHLECSDEWPYLGNGVWFRARG